MAGSARIDELKRKFDENPRRYFAPLANEYRKAGDLEQAIAICRAHLPHQPGHMSGHVVFGQALFDAGELDEAQQVFETALGLDPENLIALRQLGDISEMHGDIAGATAWYQRVLDADPRNHEIAARVRELEQAPTNGESRRFATPARGGDALGWGEINPERGAEETTAADATADAGASGDWEPTAPHWARTPPASPSLRSEEPGETDGPPRAGPVHESTLGQEADTELGALHFEPAPLRAPDRSSGFVANVSSDAGETGQEELASAPEAPDELLFESFLAPDTSPPTVEDPRADTREFDPSDLTFAADSASAAPVAGSDAADTGLESDSLAWDTGDERTTAADMDALFGDLTIGEPASTGNAEPRVSTGADFGIRLGSGDLAPRVSEDVSASVGDDTEFEFASFDSEPETAGAVQSEALSRDHLRDHSRGEDPDAFSATSPIGTPSPDADDEIEVQAGAPDATALDLAEFGASDEAAAEASAEFVTETMAALYVRQGYWEQALEVYQKLVARAPRDVALRERMAHVEQAKAGAELAAAEAAAVRAAAAVARRAEGTSVRTFFGALARRSATPANGGGPLDSLFSSPVADTDEEAAKALTRMFAGESASEPPGGRPAHKAETELSLDDVFREGDRRKTPPRGGGPLSFDEFFKEAARENASGAAGAGISAGSGGGTAARGGSRSPPGPGESRAADEGSDLEQFNAWLDGLKKK